MRRSASTDRQFIQDLASTKKYKSRALLREEARVSQIVNEKARTLGGICDDWGCPLPSGMKWGFDPPSSLQQLMLVPISAMLNSPTLVLASLIISAGIATYKYKGLAVVGMTIAIFLPMLIAIDLSIKAKKLTIL